MIVRRLADTFQDHSSAELTPWALFDISFRMPREFSLQRAQFDIGVKMLVFAWRRRRFFLWYFSCADVFLKDGRTPADWAAGYLNGFGGIRGPVFLPDGKGGIAWRRRRPHLFGHRDEIARMCFRYRTGLRLLDGNKLAVWVCSYRNESDLAALERSISFPQESRSRSWSRS